MLRTKTIISNIEKNIKSVIYKDTKKSNELLKQLFFIHHADIADLITRLNEQYQIALFKKLPRTLASNVFQYLPEAIKVTLVSQSDEEDITNILRKIPADELIDLFENLSDEDLKKYLKLLQKKQRIKIISLLHFSPESAGRLINSDVLTIQRDFTVKKCIALLQRLGEPQETLRRIYVTNKEDILVGHINLVDLVLNKPETPLTRIMHKNELTINVHEDQEDVAKQIHHYGLTSAPVIDDMGRFLGVITTEDALDILEAETSEDVYKMSGLVPPEHSYFQTSFFKLIKHRIVWLAGLLLLQSISGFVLKRYDNLISIFPVMSFFLTMLIGTGGNAGNQSATIVIRGIATGEITNRNAVKLLLREIGVAVTIASLLSIVAFGRVYAFHQNLTTTIAICLSLFLIVITSIILGSLIPLLLKKMRFDPAHSAAPFIATMMDILGVIIYCFVFSKFLT
jgi:magnesium transporter